MGCKKKNCGQKLPLNKVYKVILSRKLKERTNWANVMLNMARFIRSNSVQCYVNSGERDANPG